MNLKYADLASSARDIDCDIAVKSKVIAASIALAVAQRLPLPSAPVDDPQNFFNFQISGLMNEPLSELNEACVFDTRLAADYTRKFWMLRYSALHSCDSLLYAVNSPYGFIDTIVGTAIYIDEAMHKFVNEYKLCIYVIAAQVLRLMKQNDPQTPGGEIVHVA